MADEPTALLAAMWRKPGDWRLREAVEQALDGHAFDAYKALMEADKLRMDILKGMIDILTPLQTVELLVVSKKLHLSLHEWSKSRDNHMGISQLRDLNNPSSSHDPQPSGQLPGHGP
ncbi:hypothetical protein R6Q57_006452 [Mikania cordata]